MSPTKQLSQAQVASAIRSLKPSSIQQAHKSSTKSPEGSKWTDGQPWDDFKERPTKLNQNASVKGKKAIARTRASQSSSSIADSSSIAAREEPFQFIPKNSGKANVLKGFSIPSCDGFSKQEGERMARPKSPNETQLSSPSGSAMGNQHGSGAIDGRGSFNPCKTDLGKGLVQREALEGLERYICADGIEYKVGRSSSDYPSREECDDSVVTGPNQYTFTGGGASHDVGNDEDDRMEFEGGGDVLKPSC